MSTNTDINGIIEDFSRLELSQVLVTPDMLEQLIESMHNQKLDGLTCDVIVDKLRTLHLNKNKAERTNNSTFGRTKFDQKSPPDVNTSLNSSISSTFSFTGQNAPTSPMEFKFKTPMKGFEIKEGIFSPTSKISFTFDDKRDPSTTYNQAKEKGYIDLTNENDTSKVNTNTYQQTNSLHSPIPNLCELSSKLNSLDKNLQQINTDINNKKKDSTLSGFFELPENPNTILQKESNIKAPNNDNLSSKNQKQVEDTVPLFNPGIDQSSNKKKSSSKSKTSVKTTSSSVPTTLFKHNSAGSTSNLANKTDAPPVTQDLLKTSIFRTNNDDSSNNNDNPTTTLFSKSGASSTKSSYTNSSNGNNPSIYPSAVLSTPPRTSHRASSDIAREGSSSTAEDVGESVPMEEDEAFPTTEARQPSRSAHPDGAGVEPSDPSLKRNPIDYSPVPSPEILHTPTVKPKSLPTSTSTPFVFSLPNGGGTSLPSTPVFSMSLSPVFDPSPTATKTDEASETTKKPKETEVDGITAGIAGLRFSIGAGKGPSASVSGVNNGSEVKKKPWLSSTKAKKKSSTRSSSGYNDSNYPSESSESLSREPAAMDCSSGQSPNPLFQSAFMPPPPKTPVQQPPASPPPPPHPRTQTEEPSSPSVRTGDVPRSPQGMKTPVHESQQSSSVPSPGSSSGMRLSRTPLTRNVPVKAMPLPEENLSARMGNIADGYRRDGKNFYSKEDYEGALDCFSKALQVAPDDWPYRSSVLGNRAATYMMLDRFVEAASDCEAAAKIDPVGGQKLQGRRARALLRLGHLTAADEAFKRLLETQKDDISSQDGQNGKRQVQQARTLLTKLSDLIGKGVPKNLLSCAEELLQICPQMRSAQTFKARALCQMQRWADAKTYIETVTCLVHESIQSLHVHRNAQLPAPNPEELKWVEIGVGLIKTNVAAAVQAILFMGPEMAQCYIIALKNGDPIRNCCNDVLDSVTSILLSVSSRVGASSSSWSWVRDEEVKIRRMAEAKSAGDQYFRQKEYVKACGHYTDALKIDPDANRLNAILCSNRAAASMALGKYEDAVSDCLESIIRDPTYSRAFLRRARAYRALGSRAASVRDYRRYLSSTPAPMDYDEIKAEVDTYEQQESMKESTASSSKSEEKRPGCVPFDKDEDLPATGRFTRAESQKERATYKDAYEQTREKSKSARFSNFKQSSTSSKQGWEEAGTSKTSTNSNSRFGNSSSSSTNNGTKKGTGDSYRTTTSNNSGFQKPNVQKEPEKDKEVDPSKRDYYDLMGLSEHATDRDIKIAYRRLALRYHPDKNKDPGAEDIFKAVTSAYAVLSDKSARRTYDHTRLYSRVYGGSNYRR